MMKIIPLEDILFVFGEWTLMIRTCELDGLKLGDRLALLNEDAFQIGTATAQKFLASRNPDVQPVEISPISSPSDFKLVKYFAIAT